MLTCGGTRGTCATPVTAHAMQVLDVPASTARRQVVWNVRNATPDSTTALSPCCTGTIHSCSLQVGNDANPHRHLAHARNLAGCHGQRGPQQPHRCPLEVGGPLHLPCRMTCLRSNVMTSSLSTGLVLAWPDCSNSEQWFSYFLNPSNHRSPVKENFERYLHEVRDAYLVLLI